MVVKGKKLTQKDYLLKMKEEMKDMTLTTLEHISQQWVAAQPMVGMLMVSVNKKMVVVIFVQ